MTGFAEFMRGLVDGGPTRQGRSTPAVIVEAPVNGIDAANVHCNTCSSARSSAAVYTGSYCARLSRPMLPAPLSNPVTHPLSLAATVLVPSAIVAFEGGSLLMRALLSLAAIVPSGVLMGFGFPTGMRLVNAIDARPTPWFWAVNGAADVLAAGTAIATSVTFSINASFWVGAGCYLLITPVGVALAAMSCGLAWRSVLPRLPDDPRVDESSLLLARSRL